MEISSRFRAGAFEQKVGGKNVEKIEKSYGLELAMGPSLA